jgi:hypothetical protein
MNEKYFGNWANRDDIVTCLSNCKYEDNQAAIRAAWLGDNPNFPTDEEIIFATYDYGDYRGSAIIVFSRGGKLYEYQDSHCSCNGLEMERFIAGETSWAALAMRDYTGEYYSEDRTPEAIEAIKRLINMGG